MYPQHLTRPIKEELTSQNFQDLTTPEQVTDLFAQEDKTILLVINSVCGCGAAIARPAVLHALAQSTKKPDICATVFAGVDAEATQKAREFLRPYPPSSPSVALVRNKKILNFVERHHIEGNQAEIISEHLQSVFQKFC